MFRSLPLLFCLLAPAAVHAQSSAGDADAIFADRQAGPSGPRLTLPVIGASADSAYADARATRLDQGRTAVDYRLAPGGAFGSVGYICLDDVSPLDSHQPSIVAGTDEGRLVGASLKIPLK